MGIFNAQAPDDERLQPQRRADDISGDKSKTDQADDPRRFRLGERMRQKKAESAQLQGFGDQNDPAEEQDAEDKCQRTDADEKGDLRGGKPFVE